MKVAVTGATGFIGSRVAAALTRAGHDVIRFGRKDLPGIIIWDITRAPLATPPHVDAVVHCAAHVDDWGGYAESYQGNVLGTEHVLQTFPDVKVFVHMSSASVYDPFVGENILTETSPCGNFLNSYSLTKFEAEQVVERATQSRRVVLRPHVVYGKGDTTVLPRLMRARRGPYFIVLGSGENVISVTHVENVALAAVLAVESDLSAGFHVFNIADAKHGTVNNLLRTLIAALGLRCSLVHIGRNVSYSLGLVLEAIYRLSGATQAPIVTRYAVAQMAYGHALDISKARTQLLYEPLETFDSGMAQMKI